MAKKSLKKKSGKKWKTMRELIEKNPTVWGFVWAMVWRSSLIWLVLTLCFYLIFATLVLAVFGITGLIYLSG